jgi:hypothetical protein
MDYLANQKMGAAWTDTFPDHSIMYIKHAAALAALECVFALLIFKSALRSLATIGSTV